MEMSDTGRVQTERDNRINKLPGDIMQETKLWIFVFI